MSVASVAKQKVAESPVKIGAYITDGTVLMRVMDWLPMNEEICVENASSGKRTFVSSADVAENWRTVKPEKKKAKTDG